MSCAGARPAVVHADGSEEGCVVGSTIATMAHRPLDHAGARGAWLDMLRARRNLPSPAVSAATIDPYDDLAAHLASALDIRALHAIALGAPS